MLSRISTAKWIILIVAVAINSFHLGMRYAEYLRQGPGYIPVIQEPGSPKSVCRPVQQGSRCV